MGWNGSGQFERSNGTNSGSDVWTQDKGDGTNILASLHDVHDEDIATGLENCITRDGQNSPSSNLPMGNYKHTGVGDASAGNQYATAHQIVRGQILYAGASTGSSGAYAVTLPISPATYVTGMEIIFISNHDSDSSNSLNVNSIGAIAIHDTLGATTQGSIRNGDYVRVRYDGTYWQMIGSYGFRQRGYTPTLTGSGSMTLSSTAITRAGYSKSYSGVNITVSASFTVGGTPSEIVNITVPVRTSTVPTVLACTVWNGSAYVPAMATVFDDGVSASKIEVRKLDGVFSAGASRFVYVNGTYPEA